MDALAALLDTLRVGLRKEVGIALASLLFAIAAGVAVLPTARLRRRARQTRKRLRRERDELRDLLRELQGTPTERLDQLERDLHRDRR
jgi:hypothetical protein